MSDAAPAPESSPSAAWSTSQAFQSRSHADALKQVSAALRDGAACVVVTGASGIGKTMLCRALAASSDERTFSTALLDARLRADDMLAQLLRDFGLIADGSDGPTVSYDRQALASAASRFLASLRPLGAHVVVIVDDAERVDPEALVALHDLSHQADAGGRLLRLVLAGQPALDGRLQEPVLRQLNSHVGARVRLAPLDPDEVLPYLAHRAKGPMPAEEADFGSDLVDQIYGESEGVPSRVNFAAARARGPAMSAPFAETGDVVWQVSTAEWVDLAASVGTAGRRRWVAVAALFIAAAGAVAWWGTMRRGPRPSAEPSRPPVVTQAPVMAPVAEPVATSPDAAPARAPEPQASYRVTVASFRTAGRAEQIAAQLREQRIAATTRVDRSGTWHQVIAGPFASLEAARQTQQALARAGFPDTALTSPLPVSPEEPPR